MLLSLSFPLPKPKPLLLSIPISAAMASSLLAPVPISFALSKLAPLPLSRPRSSRHLHSPLLSAQRQSLVHATAGPGPGAGAISSLIDGPAPKRFLGDDYVVKKVTARQVHEMVKGKRQHPLIVGFYATWCGPCVHMAQELEMLAVEYEDSAIFVKVNTDEEYEFARDMQVRGLPTLYFISPDPKKNAIRTEGLVPSSMIKDIIDNEM